MRTDQCGHRVTGASAEGVARHDAAVRSLLALATDVADAWEAAVVDDPGCALGHIGRAYLRCLSSEGPDAAEARTILEGLGDGRDLTDRERRHLDAARAYAGGDLAGAAVRLDALTVEYPNDVLALAVGHQLDFFCGDAAGLRDRTGRVLLSWDPTHPLFGFVLGMHAFGLEETGLYPRAEDVGMRALDAERRDVWALHAVVHVHEMQARLEAGLAFMDGRRADWTTGNFFVVHNAWHEALFRLGLGDVDGALAVYDATLHHDGSAPVALEMLDATALLWRMHLDGIDVGGRWAPLADAWRDKAADGPWYVFNDVHAVMTYAAAGRLEDARAVVRSLQDWLAAPPPAVTNVAMTAEVGLPVCEAIVAFAEARYGEVVAALHPIRRIVHRFGGSNAQRDAVARTLLEATIRSGDERLARALVAERLALQPSSPYNRRQLARVGLRPATAPPVPTIHEHVGPREDLRDLFELAEDSRSELDRYLGEGEVLVAARTGRIVGHLQLITAPDGRSAEIKNMAVRPEEQGRGVGRLLVEAAVARARRDGARQLWVATAAADIDNLRFYQRLGFRMARIERDAFTPARGYPTPIEVDGIDLLDRVWLDTGL